MVIRVPRINVVYNPLKPSGPSNVTHDIHMGGIALSILAKVGHHPRFIEALRALEYPTTYLDPVNVALVAWQGPRETTDGCHLPLTMSKTLIVP